jgi:hypothetical protein
MSADGPQGWVDTVLQRRHDRRARVGSDDDAWLRLGDLVADEAGPLVGLHRRVMTRYRAPADTAATYLAGWFAGIVADAVGHCLATAGAGLVVDADEVQFHQHRDGWVDRLSLQGVRAVVTHDHPWAGRPDVVVVDDIASMLGDSVRALVAVVTPLVEACHGLASVGRVGLWNEVGDCLGLAIDDAAPPDESACALLAAAVAVPGTPWKATPTLRLVDDDTLGPTVVRHKGGCCLAYKCDEVTGDVEDAGPEVAAYIARFGDDAPHYCNTCRFREVDDSAARQLFWRRLEHVEQNEVTA